MNRCPSATFLLLSHTLSALLFWHHIYFICFLYFCLLNGMHTFFFSWLRTCHCFAGDFDAQVLYFISVVMLMNRFAFMYSIAFVAFKHVLLFSFIIPCIRICILNILSLSTTKISYDTFKVKRVPSWKLNAIILSYLIVINFLVAN